MGLIYLDTCLLIYLTEDHPQWSKRVTNATSAAHGAKFVISPLVKMECLVGPLKRGDSALQGEYAKSFNAFALLQMDEPVFLLAAQMRARFGLRTPDALHLACAQHHRCEALWTNDDRLTKVSHGLARKLSK